MENVKYIRLYKHMKKTIILAAPVHPFHIYYLFSLQSHTMAQVSKHEILHRMTGNSGWEMMTSRTQAPSTNIMFHLRVTITRHVDSNQDLIIPLRNTLFYMLIHRVYLGCAILDVLNVRSRMFRISRPMNQCWIIWSPRFKGMGAARIRHEREAAVGPGALSYSIVTRILPSAIWTPTDSETPHSELGNAIAQAREKVQFTSVKGLVQRVCPG
jgi:hypothetical protein